MERKFVSANFWKSHDKARSVMDLSLSSIAGYASPVVMGMLCAGAIFHAAHRSKLPGVKPVSGRKTLLLCLFHGLVAAGVYWHLISGGWLTEHYRWDDANNINLVLAIFEGAVVLLISALAITGKRFFRILLVDFLYIQILMIVMAAALILLFIFTWKPRMF